MNHLLRPALGAVLVLVVAACADPSGQPWTPPPAGTPAAETAAPGSAAPETAAPVETAAPATAAPATSAPASAAPSAPASVVPGEARVIELELDGALQIKQNGQKVTDIPVTPGETITFKLDNTAGYAHNFWIGTEQQLMTNQVQGLPGVPDWISGPQEFTWVVPDDITGLKYGCTVPGHYSLMQGTFSVAAGTPAETAAPASAAPASVAPASVAPASAAPSVAPSVPAQTGPVELTFNADGQLQRNGEKVTDIPVTPGETVEFVITNESGKPHSFYIGPSQSLLLGQVDGLVGIPEWSDAEPKQLSWEVPADITGLKFASTVGSDYGQTNGTFSVAGSAPVETAAPATAAPATAAPASAAPSAPASVVPGEARVIELELDGALQIKQNGQKVTDIPVTPGETITFKLDNTAGYAHNFWIGTDQELSVPNAATSAGVPDWSSGPQEFTWVVPDDITGLKYGCTVPGHYSLMQGTFSVAS